MSTWMRASLFWSEAIWVVGLRGFSLADLRQDWSLRLFLLRMLSEWFVFFPTCNLFWAAYLTDLKYSESEEFNEFINVFRQIPELVPIYWADHAVDTGIIGVKKVQAMEFWHWKTWRSWRNKVTWVKWPVYFHKIMIRQRFNITCWFWIYTFISKM